MSQAPDNLAVVHRRVEPADSLDYFPTPPWAGRAVIEQVIGPKGLRHLTVEEPACGEGHLAYSLSDYFRVVRASDIHDHGLRVELPFALRDFLDADSWHGIERPDWIVTNPPFGDLSWQFMVRAIARARLGVALFLRTTQLEGIRRFAKVYRRTPPTIVAPFVERVPIHKGRWLPDGDTVTAYMWLIWLRDPVTGELAKPRPPRWIMPCRDRLTFQRDVDLFGAVDEAADDVQSSEGGER